MDTRNSSLGKCNKPELGLNSVSQNIKQKIARIIMKISTIITFAADSHIYFIKVLGPGRHNLLRP